MGAGGVGLSRPCPLGLLSRVSDEPRCSSIRWSRRVAVPGGAVDAVGRAAVLAARELEESTNPCVTPSLAFESLT